MKSRSKRRRLVALAAIGIVATLAVAVSAASARSVGIGVHAGFDRTHLWQIEKSVDRTDLTLAQNESSTLNYSVKLTYLGSVDSNYEIFDGITIRGEGSTIIVNSLSDIDVTAEGFTGNANACSAAWDPFVALTPPFRGSFLACTYVLPMGDTLPGVGGVGPVNVDVTLADGSTLSQSGIFDFTIADAINELDECVDVSDTFAGALGAVCVGDQVHQPGDTVTFNYQRTVSFSECGDHDVENTASFTARDTGATGEASAHVDVTVPCGPDCTLTQGYWKTHSNRGPAPLDTTWNLLPDQPAAFDPDAVQEAQDETFFYSGNTWYGVFWTPPAGGNVYYQLAHQYMAAVLNKLNGASSTAAVDAAIGAATAYFNNPANTPTSARSLSKSAKQQLQGYASTLASYNEGEIGPGHCDD